MKTINIFLLLLSISTMSFGQTVLSGDLTMDDIPDEVKADIGAISSVEELNERIASGGKLILKNATLRVPLMYLKEVTLILEELTLDNSRIEIASHPLNILSKKFTSINGAIVNPTLSVNILNIDEFVGNLSVNLTGRDGVDGPNGARGSKGRGSRSSFLEGCTDCADGGGPGQNGADGGNGQNGGNLNIFTVYDPSLLDLDRIVFTSEGGQGGKGGNGGKGGPSGQNKSGVCQAFCANPSQGRRGSQGKVGVPGEGGILKISKIKLSDIFE